MTEKISDGETTLIRGLDLRRNIDIQAVKEFIDRLTDQETVEDLKAGGKHIMQAKIRFVNVLCRLFDWKNWQETQDTDTRAVPDQTEDRIVEFILENPKRFAGLTL